MDQFTALARARPVLESRLRAITDGDWDRPTPCAEWSVHDLVQHLVISEATVAPWVQGTPFELDDTAPGTDLVGLWRQKALEADQVLAAPGAIEAPVDHPFMGTITGEVLLGFRVTDNVVHAWDLARSIGGDEHLDEELVESLYERVSPLEGTLGGTGLFADSIPVAGTADTQTKLLALFGRDLGWRPT